MSSAIRVGRLAVLTLSIGMAFAQTNAQLRTADTEGVLEAGRDAPRVVSFSFP
jgi:hypothetical protein